MIFLSKRGHQDSNEGIEYGTSKQELIHHSGRVAQYANNEFQALLETNGIQCSMSRKGDYWDNAGVDSFFHNLTG